jgi:hypothetical protein
MSIVGLWCHIIHDVFIFMFVRYYLIENLNIGNYYEYLNVTLAKGNTITAMSDLLELT